MNDDIKFGDQQNTLAEYNVIEAALNDFRGRYSGRVYDVTTTAGMKDAKVAQAEVRGARTELERVRKAIKEPALRRCQLIDSEAKRITTAPWSIEEPTDEIIKNEEERKDREKAAREQAERERVEDIQQRMVALNRAPSWGDGTKEISKLIAEIRGVEINEATFAEFVVAALTIQSSTLITLTKALEMAAENERAAEVARIQREADEKRLAEERAAHEAKMAAERKALDEQRAVEAKAAEERKAAEKAERDRLEAEMAAERKRFEAERAEAQRIEFERQAREQSARIEAERQQRLSEAKCADLREAMTVIGDIVNNEEMMADQKVDEIRIVIEANQ